MHIHCGYNWKKEDLKYIPIVFIHLHTIVVKEYTAASSGNSACNMFRSSSNGEDPYKLRISSNCKPFPHRHNLVHKLSSICHHSVHKTAILEHWLCHLLIVCCTTYNSFSSLADSVSGLLNIATNTGLQSVCARSGGQLGMP